MPTPRRRSTRILLRAAIVLAALVLALFVAEWIVTATDACGVSYPHETMRYRQELAIATWNGPDGKLDLDGTLIEQRPGAEVRFGDFTVRTNALGFRGPEIARTKPAGTYRIVVLGDSVVFGWGVDDEVTFTRRWEKELNAGRGGRHYEVVNCGHLLYDTVQEAALFEHKVLALDPDLVLLVYVVNDVEPSRDLVEALLGMREPEHPKPPSLGDRVFSFTATFLPSLTAIFQHELGPDTDWKGLIAEHGGVYAPEEIGDGARGWQRSQDALLRIHADCEKRGVPFVVLDHSYPPIRALPVFCAAQGIRYRPLRFTAEELGMPIYNSMMDSHSNALGNELLLRKLEDAMAAEGLPPASH